MTSVDETLLSLLSQLPLDIRFLTPATAPVEHSPFALTPLAVPVKNTLLYHLTTPVGHIPLSSNSFKTPGHVPLPLDSSKASVGHSLFDFCHSSRQALLLLAPATIAIRLSLLS